MSIEIFDKLPDFEWLRLPPDEDLKHVGPSYLSRMYGFELPPSMSWLKLEVGQANNNFRQVWDEIAKRNVITKASFAETLRLNFCDLLRADEQYRAGTISPDYMHNAVYAIQLRIVRLIHRGAVGGNPMAQENREKDDLLRFFGPPPVTYPVLLKAYRIIVSASVVPWSRTPIMGITAPPLCDAMPSYVKARHQHWITALRNHLRNNQHLAEGVAIKGNKAELQEDTRQFVMAAFMIQTRIFHDVMVYTGMYAERGLGVSTVGDFSARLSSFDPTSV